jgi:hypothetical protein
LQPIAILMLPDAIPALLLPPEAQMIKPAGTRRGASGIPGPPDQRGASGRAAPEKKHREAAPSRSPAVNSKYISIT